MKTTLEKATLRNYLSWAHGNAIDITYFTGPYIYIYIYIYRYFQQQKLSVNESTSGCTFNFVSGRFEEKSPAQRKCRRVNERESDEECHCLD